MEGRHLVNVFDSDSNVSEKDPQDQDLFEVANQDNDQISVSSDGSVSLALSNSDVNDSENSIGNKDDEVDGNSNHSFSRLFSESFHTMARGGTVPRGVRRIGSEGYAWVRRK